MLLIGSLISWISFVGIGFVGALLLFIGVILVILGRKAFGAAHSRNVLISILLFFVGIVIVAIAAVTLTVAALASLFGTTPNQAAFTSALNNFLILLVVGSAVGGLASVLFTYGLQNQIGRVLLFAGYGAGIAVQIAILFVVSQAIPGFVAIAFPGGTYDAAQAAVAILDFTGRVTALSLLTAIPSLLYAAADYIAWSRISRGEIPAAPTAPAMAVPPMPPR